MKNPTNMKYLLRYFLLGISALVAANLIACAKSGSSGNANSPIPPPCVGLNCNGLFPQGTKIGFYTQTANLDQYFINNGSTLTLQPDYYNVLRYSMGVCDREQTNIGVAQCQAWQSGYHDMYIFMDSATSNTAKVVIRAYPAYNPYAWVYGTLPSLDQFFGSFLGVPSYNPAAFLNPMVLTMTVNPINESKGFVLRGNGPQFSGSWNVLMQLVVPVGHIEDPVLDFMFVWNNMDAATTFDSGRAASVGRMVRCDTEDCGLGFRP